MASTLLGIHVGLVWQGMLDKILDRPRFEECRTEEVRNKW